MKLCKEEFVTLAENITENSYQETNLSPETTRYYKVMGGIADYGDCPFASGEPYIDENGMIYFAS